MRPRARRTLLLLTATLALRAACIGAAGHPPTDDAHSRARFLVEHLTSGERGWGPSDFFAGEWHVVALSMTALSLRNLALEDPSMREQARRDAVRLADEALLPATRAFDTARYAADALQTLPGNEGHVGALGHLGLVLGVECALGGTEHRATFDVLGQVLRRRFLASPNGLIDTYPGEQWLPDSAAGLAAVELHAQCFHLPSMREVARRWPKEASGLFRFTPGSSARGSGAGFISVYLPLIDGCLAREQWALMRAQFGAAPVPGLKALREWPQGVTRAGDVDSGPLVFGLSPAGTGFALAAASSAGDDDWRAGMLRTAEGAGLTVPWGGRHYLFSPLVGDASVLAARTTPVAPACALLP